MVVLTIVTQKNGETIFFDVLLIPQVHFMKLISCSLYNSWDTLKREGSAVLGDEKRDPSVSVGRIPAGHYNLQSMAKEIEKFFKTYKYDLATKINTPFGQLEITNTGVKPINLDRDLAQLFGVGRRLNLETIVKYLRYPTAYFIHCDLIDRNFNFVNNKKSDLLAKIDVRSKAYEKEDMMLLPNSLFVTARQVLMSTVSLSASEIKMVSFLISKACHLNLNWN